MGKRHAPWRPGLSQGLGLSGPAAREPPLDRNRKTIITYWLLGSSLECLSQLEVAAQPRLHDPYERRSRKAIPPLLLPSRPLLGLPAPLVRQSAREPRPSQLCGRLWATSSSAAPPQDGVTSVSACEAPPRSLQDVTADCRGSSHCRAALHPHTEGSSPPLPKNSPSLRSPPHRCRAR